MVWGWSWVSGFKYSLGGLGCGVEMTQHLKRAPLSDTHHFGAWVAGSSDGGRWGTNGTVRLSIPTLRVGTP